MENENSCPHRDSKADSLVVKHVASLYKYCATPALLFAKYSDKIAHRVNEENVYKILVGNALKEETN
jgi:hypothetical protein